MCSSSKYFSFSIVLSGFAGPEFAGSEFALTAQAQQLVTRESGIKEDVSGADEAQEDVAAGFVSLEDPVLSNTVHDALGVDRVEELTAEQLSQITELTIDPLAFQGYYDWKSRVCRAGFYLDLSQIGCLENLETLVIDNADPAQVFQSHIYGLSGLADLKKLKSLKMAYNVNDASRTVRSKLDEGGTAALLEVAEGCEALETLDLGILPEQSVIDRLHEVNGNLTVTGGTEEELKGESDGVHYAYGTLLKVRSTDELDSCPNPEEITAVVVAGDCELGALEKMTELNTLVVTGYKSGLSSVPVNVSDFDVVARLPQLDTMVLNLCSIDADPSVLDGVKSLRTLRYTDVTQTLPDDLAIYAQLKDFAYHAAGADDTPDLSSMKELTNLVCIADSIEAAEAMQRALEESPVRCVDLWVTDNSREDEVPLMAGFNSMKRLRYLSVNGGIKTKITWEGAEKLDDLEVLKVWLKNDFPKDLGIYPELRTLVIGFEDWIQRHYEYDVDLTSAQKLSHLSFLGTGDMRDADFLMFDLTIFGGIKGLAAINERGVDIDLLSNPNYRERMAAEFS